MEKKSVLYTPKNKKDHISLTEEQKNRKNKERAITDAFQTTSNRLSSKEDFEFSDRQKAILKLKLARYFQNNETVDINTLFDAIIESPKFINTNKGSFHQLFEIHEQKTLQKIAEIRKQRAEIKGKEKNNPYEALFETESGNYYMARLFNMPHLQEESEYMKHCVGTSDSYVNKIKRGEVEILFFRNAPKINKNTQKLEGDTPIMTIEYNLKTKTIEQIKKYNDEYLDKNDLYFNDVVDALKQLRMTKTDTGELRNFSKINTSELENIKVKDYCVLTENGEIDFRDFNPDGDLFVLKTGLMEITPETSKKDASKIMKIKENIDCLPEQIAYGIDEINENTKVYIGEWNIEIAKKIPKSVEYLYESFPENKILRKTIELTTKTSEEYIKELDEQGFQQSENAKFMLNKMEILKNPESIDLVSFSVKQLGFSDGATTQEIYDKAKELGLELCPPQVGPELRLNYKDQPSGEWLRFAMEQITDSAGNPGVFLLGHGDDGLWLYSHWAEPGNRWRSSNEFVFRIRKVDA